MNETETDYRSLLILVSVLVFVLLLKRAERVRNERRQRLTDALAVLVDELMPS